jgi:hypothetical protein
VFVLTTLLTVWLFYKASNNSRRVAVILFGWLLIQGIISLTGFYTITDTVPPRFVLLIVPPLLLIAGLFALVKGRQFLDNLDLKYLTALHIVRIPVEIVLFWLFVHKAIPELMTFEGRNPDIFSGITAIAIVIIWAFGKHINAKTLLAWNCTCLVLLFNIVVNAILSAPSVLQRFAFERPNIAVFYFPFVWLPACIVPLVLLSHLASIRRLVIQIRTPKANKVAGIFATLEKQEFAVD